MNTIAPPVADPRSFATARGAPPSEIASVHWIRAIAATAVALHMIGSKHPFSADTFLPTLTHFGYLGVPMFFVVTGCVIPLALHRNRVGPGSFFRVIARRVVRLDPPYFASAVLILALNAFSAALTMYRGSWQPPSWASVAHHFLYLNDLFGTPWINGVFWTLAIEFQFYLLSALVFPRLNFTSVKNRLLLYLAIAAISWLARDTPTCLKYLDIFAFGLVPFLKIIGRVKALEATLALAFFFVSARGHHTGYYECGALAGTLLILLQLTANRVVLWFSAISYSLYLLHTPLGNRPLNLFIRFDLSEGQKILVALFTFGGMAVAARLFYLLIEAPSLRWSQKIKYHP